MRTRSCTRARVEPRLGSPVVLRSLWGAPVHLVGSACAQRAIVRVIARVGSRTSESCGRSPSGTTSGGTIEAFLAAKLSFDLG